MLDIQSNLAPSDLSPGLVRFWQLSGEKILSLEKRYDPAKGSPVFTVEGKYTSRGWTEWTQGFQFGSSLLQFDATGDEQFLKLGRAKTIAHMAPHLSHTGVHDHGFNNISTYGNLLRLMQEGRVSFQEWEKNFYELALKISGAVQAGRWTPIENGGFIYSFNGPHSLFVDTIRSVRSLVVGHQLGHFLQGEGDSKISLLERAIQHLKATSNWSIYYGQGRDRYDERGRTAHESIFNIRDGKFRCPNSQQGYSGFTTWTRGLAWAMCGFAEQLECFDQWQLGGSQSAALVAQLEESAKAVCDFYIQQTPTDGIPYWDTGAPDLGKIGDFLNQKSDPYNKFEPVDSSAAAIGCQGLLRLGNYLKQKGKPEGIKYWQAGLTVLSSLLKEPYLSQKEQHEGLILHSVYHRPNGWDYVPKGQQVPCGESSMWGDYHAREACLYLQRIVSQEPYYAFYRCVQ